MSGQASPFGYDEISSARIANHSTNATSTSHLLVPEMKYRDHVVSRLNQLGIRVDCFGAGWKAGAVLPRRFFQYCWEIEVFTQPEQLLAMGRAFPCALPNGITEKLKVKQNN